MLTVAFFIHSNKMMTREIAMRITTHSRMSMTVRRLIPTNSKPQSPLIFTSLTPLIVLVYGFRSQEAFDNHAGYSHTFSSSTFRGHLISETPYSRNLCYERIWPLLSVPSLLYLLSSYSILKALPMTILLISLVPAPISYNFASLSSLPAGTSFI